MLTPISLILWIHRPPPSTSLLLGPRIVSLILFFFPVSNSHSSLTVVDSQKKVSELDIKYVAGAEKYSLNPCY